MTHRSAALLTALLALHIPARADGDNAAECRSIPTRMPWNDYLTEAADKGCLEQIKLSLDNGANPNYEPRYPWHYWTPVRRAAAGGHAEALRLLLDNGGGADAQTFYTVLDVERLKPSSKAAVLELLMERGVSPNPTHGLLSAARNGMDGLASMFLERGGDPNFQHVINEERFGPGRPTGWTAFHYLAFVRHDPQGRRAEAVEQAIARGADVNRPIGGDGQNRGLTALDLARQRGADDIVAVLLKHGAVSGADAPKR